MSEIGGFWSYVHADDDAERGRITQLAEDIKSEYELLTGEPISLFLDRDDIEWGDAWRSRIDESLASVAFFIPVLTPRYFLSPECRRELRFFADRTTKLGISELVLPLLYVDVPGLHKDAPDDELLALVKDFQRVDWTDLRLAALDSEAYRRAIARLASQLVKANAEAARADVPQAAAELEGKPEAGDEELGTLDRMAAMELTMPEWVGTLEAMTEEATKIGELLNDASADIERGNAQGHGLAARLSIARRLAKQLADPAEHVYSLGSEFAAQLHTVDDGLRPLLEGIPTELESDPSGTTAVCEFFQVIRQLASSTNEALTGISQLLELFGPIEASSRDLRVPIRRLRAGLTPMLEARQVADEWVRLINEAGVDCDDEVSSGAPPDPSVWVDRRHRPLLVPPSTKRVQSVVGYQAVLARSSSARLM